MLTGTTRGSVRSVTMVRLIVALNALPIAVSIYLLWDYIEYSLVKLLIH